MALYLWQGLQVGAAMDHIAGTLGGVTMDARRDAVDGFLASFLAEEIMSPAGATELLSVAFQLAGRTGRTFTPPVLTTHTNMPGLLILDPIYDVDEQALPSAPPQDAGA